VVLMDVSMPRRDGIEATEEIETRWPTVRVLIVTGTDTAATWKRPVLASSSERTPPISPASFRSHSRRRTSRGTSKAAFSAARTPDSYGACRGEGVG
jgi:CheY-like chemotaxis protein